MAESIALCCDCMEYMRTLPDKAFDLAVVDPPYGIGALTMQYTKNGGKQYGHWKAKRRDYCRQADWDVKPTREYFDELFRVSKRQIVWGGNYFSDMLPPSKTFICWDKRIDGLENPFADCELAWCSEGMGVARMFRYLYNGMIEKDMKNKEDRFHPTQKPVALYRWIFRRYAKPGERILDTHLGSGSSRIAAYDAGLDFVGCEIDLEYFQKEEARFAAHAAQQSLFVGAEQIGMEEI